MTRMACLVCLTVMVAVSTFAAGNVSAGKATYDKACKGCHGASGAPNQGIAKTMKLEMLHLGDPAVQGMSDDQLKSLIAAGKGKMKPVKSVSGQAADDVVAYMRTLKK